MAYPGHEVAVFRGPAQSSSLPLSVRSRIMRLNPSLLLPIALLALVATGRAESRAWSNREGKAIKAELTAYDPVTGKVWRRIKHFSGYNVAAGDEAIDASLNRVGQRGGYMLASGRDSSSR